MTLWLCFVKLYKRYMKYFEDSSKKFFEIHIRLNVISIGGNKKELSNDSSEVKLKYMFTQK